MTILIVGAGPTGLTAGVELARRGIIPHIVDRNEGPTPLSKAVGISSRSLDILERSGVTDRLLAAGIRVQRGHVHSEGRRVGTIRLCAIPHRFNFLLALPQSDTETILETQLREMGGAVDRRTKLVELRQTGDRIDAVLDGPGGRQEARYDHVFGADGAHSTVRSEMGVSFVGYTHDRVWSIADAEITDWPYEAGSANVFLHKGGDVGFIIPIGERRFRAVSNTDDALAHVQGNYRVARLLRTDTFQIPVRQAAKYQIGCVFLGGDAAHVHSPVGGRGMNLGIEDAASFARRFAQDDLDGYTGERWPIARRWIRFSERALATVQATNPFTVAARGLAFRVVGALPSLQRPVLERVSGLRE